MKTLITLAALALLTSCGKVLSPEQLLNPNYDQAKQSDLDKIERRIDILEQRINEAYNSLDNLTNSINNLEVNQDTLEQSIALTLANVTNLELAMEGLGETVIKIIDPCGNNENEFDEVLLQLSDGTFIAYFEQGQGQGNQKRFLTSLPDGNYQTTDSQQCNFSIVNGKYQEH